MHVENNVCESLFGTLFNTKKLGIMDMHDLI
jgi:hypothetical protein